METQSYDLMIKTLQAAPLPALFAILLWFGIFRFWPWYQQKENQRIAFEEEYKTSWLKTAQMQADRMEALVNEFEDMRHDLNAVLMLLARDKPELIEFFKARERRKGAS